mgnify:CR=1 FL=1
MTMVFKTKIELSIPDEMQEYEEELHYFFTTMIKKLYTNRHKGFSKDFSLRMLLKGLDKEIDELLDAISNKGQFEVAVEAADVANFGFLLALAAQHMDRAEFDRTRPRIQDEADKPAKVEQDMSGVLR